MKILLVEDNEMNRDMLSRRLEKRGFQVVLAVDGREGISRACEERPALILMDLSLPDIDGWEAARQLKARADTRHIPILALTAHAMPGDDERAREVGCDGYDTKPVDIEMLLKKVHALVGGPGSRPLE